MDAQVIVHCDHCGEVVFDRYVLVSYMVRDGEPLKCLPCYRKERP